MNIKQLTLSNIELEAQHPDMFFISADVTFQGKTEMLQESVNKLYTSDGGETSGWEVEKTDSNIDQCQQDETFNLFSHQDIVDGGDVKNAFDEYLFENESLANEIFSS